MRACPFRHHAACTPNRKCVKWLQGSCFLTDCSFYHPPSLWNEAVKQTHSEKLLYFAVFYDNNIQTYPKSH